MSYTCTWGLLKWLTWSPVNIQILPAERKTNLFRHHKCAKFVCRCTMFSALMLMSHCVWVHRSTDLILKHFLTVFCCVLSGPQRCIFLSVFIRVFPCLEACVGNREQISLNFCVPVFTFFGSFFCFKVFVILSVFYLNIKTLKCLSIVITERISLKEFGNFLLLFNNINFCMNPCLRWMIWSRTFYRLLKKYNKTMLFEWSHK